MPPLRIEEVKVHRDARGVVFEPLDAGRIAGQRNVHIVVTEPGGVRANHYHRRGDEVMTVYGPALVRYRENGEVTERIVSAEQALRFIFPAGVTHAIQNIGTKPNLLIAFNTEEHDPVDPDVVADILIAPAERPA